MTAIKSSYMDGFVEVAPDVFVKGAELIVVGKPKTNDESHNCDAMGCGWNHVLYRAQITEVKA